MSDETITRDVVRSETVTIPAGHKVCPRCKGRGLMSKYDEGWRSVVYSARLAAKKACIVCQARGYVPE